MQLDELELVNCCQHQHFKHKFRSGITGILGPNGSGKSNLLRMMSANLLCNFRSSGYSLSDNISFGARAASVIGTWRHKEIKFTIRRDLNSNGCKSLYRDNNGSTLDHVMEIDRRLAHIVGCSRKVLDDYVFVDQWGVFGFLFATPSERTMNFMQLCNMEYVSKIRRQIQFHIREDAKFITSSIDDLDLLGKEIVEVNDKLATERANYGALEKFVLSKEDVKYCRDQIKYYEQVETLNKELLEVTRMLEQKEAELKIANEVQRRLQERLSSLDKLVEESYEQVADSKVFMTRLEYLDQKKITLVGRREELHKIISKQVEPPVCDIDETTEQLYKQVLELQDKCAHYSEKIRLFIDEGVTACPVCDTKVESIEDLDALKEIRNATSARLQEAEQKLEQRKNYEKKLAEWQKSTAVRSGVVESIKLDIERLESEIEETTKSFEGVDLDRVSQILKAHEQLQEKRSSVAEELAEESQKASELAGEHKSLTERIEKIKVKLLDTPAVTVDIYQTCKQSLKKREEAIARRELQLKYIRELETRLSRLTRKCTAVEELQLRNNVTKKWLVKLEGLRDLFSILPNMVMSSFMEKIVEETSKYLELFNSPFEVRAGKTFSVEVRKPQTDWFNSKRLSGGEKVVLALAVRLAISSLFARDLGILVLDEPTAGMDTDNVDYLCDVLTSLGALLKKADEQVIMVTHDTRLERAFDDVIVLGKRQ